MANNKKSFSDESLLGTINKNKKEINIDFSAQGRLALKKLESVEYELYNDEGGKPTIGVGHLLTQRELEAGLLFIDGNSVDYTKGLTDSQVDQLLYQDLKPFRDVVRNLVKVKLTQNQYDALVIFSFNVGVTAFTNSTLLRVLNKGNYDEIPAQLRRWVYVRDVETKKMVKSHGLENRRNAEVDIWSKNKYIM